MPSPASTSHRTLEKELRSVVLSHLLPPHPTAFLLNGGKCNNGVEADSEGMGLSPQPREAEGSLEDQKDEFQRDPNGDLCGDPSRDGVSVSSDADLKPLSRCLSWWGCAEPWYSNAVV